MRSLLFGLTVAVAGALALWSCGGGASTSTGGAPAAPSATPAATSTAITVSIASSIGSGAYVPNPVPVAVGNAVAFKNNDTTTHHIVMNDGTDLGDLAPGTTSRTVIVRDGGTTFHCTIHSSMVGAINGPVPEAPPCPQGAGYC